LGLLSLAVRVFEFEAQIVFLPLAQTSEFEAQIVLEFEAQIVFALSARLPSFFEAQI